MRIKNRYAGGLFEKSRRKTPGQGRSLHTEKVFSLLTPNISRKNGVGSIKILHTEKAFSGLFRKNFPGTENVPEEHSPLPTSVFHRMTGRYEGSGDSKRPKTEMCRVLSVRNRRQAMSFPAIGFYRQPRISRVNIYIPKNRCRFSGMLFCLRHRRAETTRLQKDTERTQIRHIDKGTEHYRLCPN